MKVYIVKPLNSGHLRVLTNLSVIERCPLLGGNLKTIATFGTKCFVHYSRHVRYLGCPLLGGFTVYSESVLKNFKRCLKTFLRRNKTKQKMPSFLSRAPTHRSVTFTLQFVYELKHTRHNSFQN